MLEGLEDNGGDSRDKDVEQMVEFVEANVTVDKLGEAGTSIGFVFELW